MSDQPILSNMNKKVLIIIILLLCQPLLYAQDGDPIFTIYLVRHAEKDLTSKDAKNPPLTPCGQQRAASLDLFLEKVDLNAIYSTDYIRTLGTAGPVAKSKGLEIELYNPKGLEDFARYLLAGKEDALVVGHSNSTSTLAGYLVGSEFEPIDESIYDRIYQVVVYQDKARLHILQSSFSCTESD